MLSYQHGYHAGNFADVHKHTALCLLLKELGQTTSMVSYLDSHAGRGLYSLDGDQAEKTGEWRDGIGVLKAAAPHHPALQGYLATVSIFEEGIYPGSPALMRHYMAPNHRALFWELHPAEHECLQENFKEDKRISIHQLDAYESLLDYLPARKQPGLLLIDPPYEMKDDYTKVSRLANGVQKRWPGGTLMIWYPVLPEGRHEELKSGLKNARFYELVGPKKERGMYGTGLALINAPGDFDAAFKPAEQEMQQLLFAA